MKVWIAAFVAFFVVVSAIYIISPDVRTIWIQALSLISPTGAVVIGILTIRRFGLKSANGLALMLLTAGLTG
jgi:hypothetical protein